MALSQTLIDQYASLESDFTIKQANAVRNLMNEVLSEITAIENQIGTIQIGDLSGAADTNQLTYDSATETWIPGAAADGS